MPIKKLNRLALVVLPLFICTLALSACGIKYSDGDRTGIVTKLSYKGLLMCKSWEGELVMGGINQYSAMANVFKFSVLDQVVVTKLQEKMRESKPVTLHYKETLFNISCFQGTSYVITDVN